MGNQQPFANLLASIEINIL